MAVALNIRVSVGVLDVPLLIQLIANVPQKAVEDGPGIWVPTTQVESDGSSAGKNFRKYIHHDTDSSEPGPVGQPSTTFSFPRT